MSGIKAMARQARNAAAGAVVEQAETVEAKTGGDLSPEKEAATDVAGEGVVQSLKSHMTETDRAQGNASGAVELVVALVVGGLMAAFLLPIAIDQIVQVDTTGWTGGAAAMWDILPVMIVLAIFLFFVGVALKRSGRI